MFIFKYLYLFIDIVYVYELYFIKYLEILKNVNRIKNFYGILIIFFNDVCYNYRGK